MVFLDPRTGELLALASRQTATGRARRAPRPSPIPFEPGSTAKLFTAAALLLHHRVDSTDAVFGENGDVAHAGHRSRADPADHTTRTRRTGNLTLAQAIQVSSNIAMAKFSSRLTPEEQYEMLRDFGFGTPTGVEFPSESRGRLARPDRWQPMYTRASWRWATSSA